MLGGLIFLLGLVFLKFKMECLLVGRGGSEFFFFILLIFGELLVLLCVFLLVFVFCWIIVVIFLFWIGVGGVVIVVSEELFGIDDMLVNEFILGFGLLMEVGVGGGGGGCLVLVNVGLGMVVGVVRMGLVGEVGIDDGFWKCGCEVVVVNDCVGLGEMMEVGGLIRLVIDGDVLVLLGVWVGV